MGENVKNETPASDVAMPVVAWIRAGATLPDRKGLETCAEGEGFAVIRQTDAQAALAAKDAEIARLTAERAQHWRRVMSLQSWWTR